MKENEIIKEAFSKLSEHQITPPSGLWSGIEQSVQSAAAGGSASGGLASSLLGKIAIGVVVLSTAIAAIVMNSSEDEISTTPANVVSEPSISDNTTSPAPTTKNILTPAQETTKNPTTKTQRDLISHEQETNSNSSEQAEDLNQNIQQESIDYIEQETTETSASSRSMAGFDQEFLDEYIANQSNEEIKVVDVDFRSSQDENNPLMWTFRNTSENGLEYSWSFGDGTTSDLENPTHLFEQEGSYTVELVVKGSFNQVSSISQSLNIFFPADWTKIPNIFTPNGDGENDQFDPMHNAKNVRFESITIFDVKTGKEVFRSNSEAHLWDGYNLEGDLCEPGMYQASIIGLQNDGNYSTKKHFVLLRR